MFATPTGINVRILEVYWISDVSPIVTKIRNRLSRLIYSVEMLNKNEFVNAISQTRGWSIESHHACEYSISSQ